MSFPLPRELVDRTVDYLAGDFESLRSCALSNSIFLPRCRYHLFQSVRIGFSPFTLDADKNWKPHPLLLELSNPKAYLCASIRHLHVNENMFSIPHPSIPEQSLLAEFLSRLQHLENVKISRCATIPTHPNAWSKIPMDVAASLSKSKHLRRIELDQLSLPTASFMCAFLSAASSPTFRELLLSDIEFSSVSPPPSSAIPTKSGPIVLDEFKVTIFETAEAVPPDHHAFHACFDLTKLRKFTSAANFLWESEQIDSVIKGCSATLEHLDLYYVGEDDDLARFDIQTLPVLRTLTIRHDWEPDMLPEYENFGRVSWICDCLTTAINTSCQFESFTLILSEYEIQQTLKVDAMSLVKEYVWSAFNEVFMQVGRDKLPGGGVTVRILGDVENPPRGAPWRPADIAESFAILKDNGMIEVVTDTPYEWHV